MKVMAFLQNQWFKSPERMVGILNGPTFKGNREYFNKTFLFWGCLTGKRLQRAFTEDLCDTIIWEEASPKMGGESKACYPPEPAHMAAAIRKHRPGVVLVFGRIASDGMDAVMRDWSEPPPPFFQIIKGPHPAARGGDVCGELAAMCEKLVALLP